MELPEDVLADAQAIRESCIIPPNSAPVYRRTYDEYLKWKSGKDNVTSDCEDVLLSHFKYLASKFKPPTLWVRYSHLNASIFLNTGVSIAEYKNLKMFIKRANEGYEPNKAHILSQEQITHYISTAPTSALLNKVILIFGFLGAMRKTDIYDLKYSDVEDKGDKIKVSFAEAKNKRKRTFFLVNDSSGKIDILSLVREYMKIRSPSKLLPFFLQIRNGKVWGQRVGKTTFSDNCKIVAKFLDLPEHEKFTSHCVRRSAASAMAENGVSFMEIKNYVGWKSDRAAQGYIEQSAASKVNVAQAILNKEGASKQVQPPTHESSRMLSPIEAEATSTKTSGNSYVPDINFGSGNSIGNLTITINVTPV